MKKRFVAGSLWFLAVWASYELLWSLTGVPRQVGPLLAFVVSALIVADPAGLIWPVQQKPRAAASAILRTESRAPLASK